MTNKMERCITLFIIVSAVHVLSGFSAHHQELKSVHASSGICQTFLLLLLEWMSWDAVLAVAACAVVVVLSDITVWLLMTD
jgi:hypothetical protein